MTVGILSVRLGHIAAISKVPRRRCRVSWVGIIGSDLSISAHGIKDNQSNGAENRYNGIPNSHDDRNELGEEEEERDDGDGDIEISEPIYRRVNKGLISRHQALDKLTFVTR